MSVHDLWKGYSAQEIKVARKSNANRWQRRWRGPERLPNGKLKTHKQTYKEHQKAQADLDDAKQRSDRTAGQIVNHAVTVATLLDRHLAAKSGKAPKTVENYEHHARAVREEFGDRVVSTIDTTEIEVWTQRDGIALSSKKKQLEIMRAAFQRGLRDGLVSTDPTGDLVVSLGHSERPNYSSEELMAILAGARDDFDRAFLGALGLMGLREGEARSLKVGDLHGGVLRVTNSGGGSDSTKTRAARRRLPVPAVLLPWLTGLAEGRSKFEWLFQSPRKVDSAVAKGYGNQALTFAVAEANKYRTEPIKLHSAHAMRHSFAAMALSELQADVLSVSRALGHSRPSTTLNHYGHLAPHGLAPLMGGIDAVVSGKGE